MEFKSKNQVVLKKLMAEIVGHHGCAQKMRGVCPQESMMGMIILLMGSALMLLVIMAGLMTGVPLVIAVAF
ncbi:MAG: hypothetical protein FJX04_03500 [Alphaproteobacteria bacterium]|nr:hypothetical protein [Alphaproteobacteria bacterium]